MSYVALPDPPYRRWGAHMQNQTSNLRLMLQFSKLWNVCLPIANCFDTRPKNYPSCARQERLRLSCCFGKGDQFGEGGDVYPPHDDPYYESTEEKKVAQDEHGENGMGYKPAALTVDTEAEFTPIKREGYKLGPSPSPRSQLSARSNETGTPVSQSSALRGAQELLKKNRRRRLEM